MPVAEIAARLGRHRSTIYRELGRNRFRDPDASRDSRRNMSGGHRLAVGALRAAGADECVRASGAGSGGLKNGVALMRRVIDAGVNLALGCDNCSCGDCQSMFTAMKLLCLLTAGADPNPTGVLAADAVAAATTGGARAVGLEGVVGAIAPGMQADLLFLDLRDIAYVPLNSAARQVVFAESGRGVHSVMVGGRMVLDAGRVTTIDEAALRDEAAAVMPGFRRDYARQARRAATATPWLLEANRRVANHALNARPGSLNRFIPG